MTALTSLQAFRGNPACWYAAMDCRGLRPRSDEAGSSLRAERGNPSTWVGLTALARGIVAGFLLLAAFLATAADGSAVTSARVPQPVIEAARGASCVAEPGFMRRNHMDLLKHQRDDTLRRGVRQTKYSLKECIACHASQRTNSVTAASSNFCQSCHAYAAVHIDCFECHANQPQAKP
jgi:hypothetical protein